MRKFTTFFALAAGVMLSGAVSAQTVIWGGAGDPDSEFANGLNGWTAVGIRCSPNSGGQAVDSTNALWEWKADASPVGGAYATGIAPITSASAANGAALFNSDRLDNNGTQGNFGNGPCPTPHRGELISPVIDCSGHASVAVKFHQGTRKFTGTRYLVEVSTDGGTTWSTFETNTEIAVNAPASDGVKIVDITSAAANQANVQIRFVFDGDYYYWLIDDVQLITLPDNSISLNRHFYPASTLYTPSVMAPADTFLFAARLSNNGGNVIDNSFLKVQILDAASDEVWADSLTLGQLRTGLQDSVLLFPDDFRYVPEGLGAGEYRLRYSLYQEGVTDFEPSDNTRQSSFFITDNSFWQSGALRTYTRPCFDPQCTSTAPWSWGAFFSIPEGTAESYKVVSAEVAVAGESTTADLEGKDINVFMMEILTTGFFEQGVSFGDGTTNDYAGFGERVITAAQSQTSFAIDMEDANAPGEAFVLQNGTLYMGIVRVPDRVRIGCDNAYINYPREMGDNQVILTSRLFFDNAFQSTFRNTMPYLKLNMALSTSVDNTPLPEAAMQLFPNPASSSVNIDLNLEEATNVTITLADISGKVIKFQNIQGVAQHLHTLDISSLPSGTYIVRLATDKGTSTKKLVVAK